MIQFVRYLFVGGLSAMIDTGTLLLLHSQFGVPPLSAAAIGFILGLLTNYGLSVLWVFESNGRFLNELFLFAVIGATGLFWTEAILWVSLNLLHLPVLGGKLVSLVLVVMWNFGMRKKFVFVTSSATSANG